MSDKNGRMDEEKEVKIPEDQEGQEVSENFDLEDILNEAQDGYVIWTVPRSSVIGDIVLYYHAKTALQSIRSLKRIARNLDGTEYEDLDFAYSLTAQYWHYTKEDKDDALIINPDKILVFMSFSFICRQIYGF